MKYSEKDGSFTVFRSPSNYANGNTRDRQGRLVTCEHSVTRRITRTEKNNKITVLAEKYEGKRLNAPNDIVVKSDDTIWFTDPTFGINGDWEGNREKPEQAATNVFRIGTDGKLTAVITDLVNPNGLAYESLSPKSPCRGRRCATNTIVDVLVSSLRMMGASAEWLRRQAARSDRRARRNGCLVGSQPAGTSGKK
jgi:hypothetical protein